jgi:hypothetical protein
MAFDHHYYQGAAEAHKFEVDALHKAATCVGRTEQWFAAVDYMKILEKRIGDLELSLSFIIEKAERNPSASDVLAIARAAKRTLDP